MSQFSNLRRESAHSSAEKNFPTASIVVLNYNGHQLLEKFLPSLVKTDYPDFEIIVVDNGSTDRSTEFLKTNWHHCIRIIELHENLGFAEGNNVGIHNAKGEIIALLNNDIEVDKNWLRRAVEVLKSNENVAAVQPKMMQYIERDKIDCAGLSFDKFGLVVNIGRQERDNGHYDHLHEIWGCCGGAMIGWKQRLIEVGLFDNSFFMYYEDVDLSWRLKLAGYKMLLAPSSVVYHMGQATSNRAPSGFIVFHSTKNYIYSWLKNYSLRTLIFKCPLLFFVVTGSLLFEIVYGRFDLFVARFKSIVWIWRNIRILLRERHRVQHVLRKKKVRDDSLFTLDKKVRSGNLLFIIKSILGTS